MNRIENITIAQCLDQGVQNDVHLIENATVVWQEDIIVWVGKTKEMPEQYEHSNIVLQNGGFLVPGLIDCHTHLAFGGWRADEFGERVSGTPYAEITKRGGGISSTVADTRAASKEELIEKANEFLTEMTDEQLIALLANEDVPVVGIALAQLGPEKRMIILERMKPEQKGKVLIELGSLQEIPLEAIVEVAGKLKEKASYLPKPVEFSRGGAKEIADLIGEMDADEGERYMQTLQNENSELYKAVKMLVLTFEDILENFPDGILRDLCNSVELDALSMAMKGIDQEIVDRVIGNLPQKKQAMFEPVEGPKPKREVDDARKIIVSAAKEMEKEGVFNLADMMGGGEMVE